MLNTELDVLNFWNENKIFEKSLEQTKKAQPFVFFDGPPFGSGLPHWGHILVSQVKDTMLRYQTQKGRYVPRRWGWDCHGVPIEKIVEKQLEIKDKRQIENEIGIEKFNQLCRQNILQYDLEWRKTIQRIGRWVDMDDQYRTMDNDYVESVWWGLGKLWQKGLIYKDYRISLYSPSIGVPLSHTDIAMEVKYENETLKTPIVRFETTPEASAKLVNKVQEQISFNYSEQVRYKTDVERRVEVLERGNTVRKVKNSDLNKPNKLAFDSINWDNFKTDSEALEELKQLKQQYEIILENIDTLAKLKAILETKTKLHLLSWTTTPWTLPANVALAVGSEIEYSMYFLGGSNELVILAEESAVKTLSLQLHEAVFNSPNLQEELKNIKDSAEYFKKLGIDIVKIASFKGTDFEGLEYTPLFPHPDTDKIESYEQKANLYKVYATDFVTDTEGTGIVHIAPAYGQEDFDLKRKRNLPVVTSLNKSGEIRDDLNPQLKASFGKSYLAANEIILDILEKKGSLFVTLLYSHKVPYYDRDGKKVYYSAEEGWFIAETKLKARSLELNNEIDWYPEFLKEGRFGNGLDTAPDWSISRSRYWGSPLPIWQTAEKDKTLFVDSLEKLTKYAVNPIYTLVNSSQLQDDLYANGKAVIFGDSETKLPLGVNAVQYRSKNLTLMREQKELSIKIFAEYAQKMLDEILDLFNRYHTVQLLFTPEEQKYWTTWLHTLHPENKKITHLFYFYRPVEKNLEDEFEPTGNLKMLDLHRPAIDDIILKDEVGNVYTRIPDVLDTWVDSGSMPWASWHYPFENKEFVENNHPADWIQESQDQTRGWFRTLHVLSTGIFNKQAFKAVNTTGMVLASDGKKMSKSKGNFTDPNILIDKFGADAVRNYLLNSNLLEADNLKFKDEDLQTTFRETTLLLSNSARYVKMVIQQYARDEQPKAFKHSLNKWWMAYTKAYAIEVKNLMDGYQIQTASRLIIPYIRDFSTWYIRRSKDILETHGREVAACLQESLRLFSTITASLQPFNAEKLWSVVKYESDPESVHLTSIPKLESLSLDQETILAKMEVLREIVSKIHSLRKEKNIRVRQPLYADFANFKITADLQEIISLECNLLTKDLSKTEGEIFENQSDFGMLKIDLVIDKELNILGLVRDFERAVQEFRKQQGFKAGEIISMEWQLQDVVDEALLQGVLEALNWDKLCLEVKWVKNLKPEIDKKFEVKGLVTILVN